jgi:hypothetical protein
MHCPDQRQSVTLYENGSTTEATSCMYRYTVHAATAEGNCFSIAFFWYLPFTKSSLHVATTASNFSQRFSFRNHRE